MQPFKLDTYANTVADIEDIKPLLLRSEVGAEEGVVLDSVTGRECRGRAVMGRLGCICLG